MVNNPFKYIDPSGMGRLFPGEPGYAGDSNHPNEHRLLDTDGTGGGSIVSNGQNPWSVFTSAQNAGYNGSYADFLNQYCLQGGQSLMTLRTNEESINNESGNFTCYGYIPGTFFPMLYHNPGSVSITDYSVTINFPSGQGGGFNINYAVNTLNENANERSVHACGRYMGLGLQAGGIKGAMADGKDYGPILLKNDFNVVSKTGYSPIKGDVTVYDGNASHKWGHVQMYNGNQWVSDFFQGYIGVKTGYEYGGNGFMVYTKDIPSLTIYRVGN